MPQGPAVFFPGQHKDDKQHCRSWACRSFKWQMAIGYTWLRRWDLKQEILENPHPGPSWWLAKVDWQKLTAPAWSDDVQEIEQRCQKFWSLEKEIWNVLSCSSCSSATLQGYWMHLNWQSFQSTWRPHAVSPRVHLCKSRMISYLPPPLYDLGWKVNPPKC